MAEASGPNAAGRVWLQNRVMRYSAALAASGIALGVWSLWPALHDAPFIVFLAAVVVTARVFGFGPALLCTLASGLAIDYFILEPRFSFSIGRNDWARLIVFFGVSVLAAGLARKRWQAETRAGQIQRWMASIVESSADAILTKDKNGIITSWNSGAERLYGYAAAEAIGRPVSMLVAPGQPDEIPGFLERLGRGEPIQHHATVRLRQDGTRILVDLCLSPVRDQHGEIVGASSIAHDISLQRRAEEALRRNEKLATAGRMAAAVVHEINNPLEAVTNLLYLARHSPDHATKYLDMADQELHRIAEITQQMLGFVREPSAPTTLNVAGTIEEVLQLYLRKLSQKQIRVEKHYDGDPRVRGFAGELRQLFSNLVLNAADAVGPGGRLVIHVAPSRDWRTPRRPGVRVTVADNGSGVRPGDRPHVFEPFYTTKGDLGTGLGLWVSHAIVQKHGGTIRVRSRSTPGASGTVFSLFLPESTGKPVTDGLRALLADSPAAEPSPLPPRPRVDRKIS